MTRVAVESNAPLHQTVVVPGRTFKTSPLQRLYRQLVAGAPSPKRKLQVRETNMTVS